MTRTFLGFSLLLTVAFTAPAQVPRSTAEATDFQSTTRHADVVVFCETLAKMSPVVKLEWMGVTGEGRKLPYLTLSEGGDSDKPVVLLIGNIHAGEVDGKEALLTFARQLSNGPDRALLKDLVVHILPILNADGNEKVGKGKRPEQAGPDEIGDRENAAGLDLNRDFMKLESPEVRALVKLIRAKNPAVVIDTHTTNGSFHRHAMTYDGPRHPDAGGKRLDFANGLLIPGANKRLQAATGIIPAPYGYFSQDRSRWESYPALPRYGIQYVAVRGRIGVLSESYVYAAFRDRVKASLEYVRAVCQEAAARKTELIAAVNDATPATRVALRTKLVADESSMTVLGYVEETVDGKRKPTAALKEYPVKFAGRVETTLETTLPFAYLVHGKYVAAVQNLQRHGITVNELREDIDLDVEAFRVVHHSKAARRYQGHELTALSVKPITEPRRVPAGTVVVRTAQSLGRLAALLLEPMSEDGLTVWNFFDEGLAVGGDFPVMRLPAEAVFVTGAVRPLPEDRQKDRPLDLSTLFGQGPPPNFAGLPVAGITWLEDGEHFLQTKNGKPHKVHARTGRATPYLDAKLLEKSLLALKDLGDETARDLSRGNYPMDPARTGVLIEHRGDFLFAKLDGSGAVRVTKSAGAKEGLTFSPDGAKLAFTRAGNLFVVDIATQVEKQLTNDGGGTILNGKADWVYFEEIFDRKSKAFWWSPDSTTIAFLRFDDAPVKAFSVVNHLPTQLAVEQTPYPKAGDPNPLVQLGVVSATGGEPKFVEFPGADPKDFLIARVGWRPESKHVYAYAQNRTQTWCDVGVAPAEGGAFKPLFRDTTKAWVDDTGPLEFLPDGSFLYASDRTGWRHLYRYGADGILKNAVTTGDWEVKKLERVDAIGGWVYFTCNKDCHHAANICRAKLDGSAIERLTPEFGTHTANVSPTGSLFVDTYSSLESPTKIVLKTGDGSLVRTLDSNPVYLREEYKFGRVEPVTIPLADGFKLWGTITYPPDFDEKKSYPVWLKTYAGPHSPSIGDSWGGGRVDDQVLARLGIIVFHVDPRPASGQGQQSAWTAYKKLGQQELKDLEAAVDWLAKSPWIDAKRVGLAGHSYGGYITAYALTHSKKFCAGVSGAPVTDWRNYDSIYTERYMGLPKDNKAGYDAGSVVKAARNLHGRLLLLHGLMDDNVHVQNSVQFIHELQRADKDFELMVYPMSRHGLFGRHYQRQIINFIAKSLGVDAHVPGR